MSQSYSGGKFEFFVVATVIAIIALVGLDRYNLMAKDARILRLEIISHHFMISASHFRVQYLLSKIGNNERLAADAIESTVNKKEFSEAPIIYFSDQGWPASVSGPVPATFSPSDTDCVQLWQQLLQNPGRIASGEFTPTKHKYRAFAANDHCRYALTDGAAYFDYFPLSGRLLFSAISN